MAMFLTSLEALESNARVLREVSNLANTRVVLALKAFACWPVFSRLSCFLDGCCASGLYEARLAQDYFKGDVLTYSPAYSGEEEVWELCEISTHLDFNSLSQWERYRDLVLGHPRCIAGELDFGLRINPELSTGQTLFYDPCAPGSRLGVTAEELSGADLSGISTLHFHTLCEQGADDLEKTLEVVEQKFGGVLGSEQIKNLNLGGGHWITKPDYDCGRLVGLLRGVQERYRVNTWLEPGEALSIHTGVLRACVLDVYRSAGKQQVIIDASATAHMPDTLEMPYRPDIFLVDEAEGAEGGTEPAVSLDGERYHLASGAGSTPHSYQVGGPTCLAGDVLGEYSFMRPLKVGDILVLDDMAHYTMVKTTYFNGVPHPQVAILHPGGQVEVVRSFGYEDYRDKLARSS